MAKLKKCTATPLHQQCFCCGGVGVVISNLGSMFDSCDKIIVSCSWCQEYIEVNKNDNNIYSIFDVWNRTQNRLSRLAKKQSSKHNNRRT